VDALNNSSSVNISLGYNFGGAPTIGAANRGDIDLDFVPGVGDSTLGVLITHPSELNRNNVAFGDDAGPVYMTTATSINTATGDYTQHTHVAAPAGTGNVASGQEGNVNFNYGFFRFADGYIGGNVINSANNGELTSFTGSAGITVSQVAAGPNVIFDSATAAAGIYELNLTGASSQNGLLIVSGGKNEDNYALSRANADGTFTLVCKDNGADAQSYENDPVTFVYVPLSKANAGASEIIAMGRISGNASTILGNGNYSITNTGTGTYRLTVPGVNPLQSSLLLSPETGVTTGLNVDNIYLFEADATGWTINGRDLPGGGLQTAGATEAIFSFVVLIPEPTSGIALLSGVAILSLVRRRRA
jgi:hypothetical protein